jgi:uridine kinase
MRKLEERADPRALRTMLQRLDQFGDDIDHTLSVLEDRVAAQEEMIIDLVTENRRLRRALIEDKVSH